MAKKQAPWTYGKSPAPTNWHETADALKSLAPKKKSSSNLLERLTALETQMKDKK